MVRREKSVENATQFYYTFRFAPSDTLRLQQPAHINHTITEQNVY